MLNKSRLTNVGNTPAISHSSFSVFIMPAIQDYKTRTKYAIECTGFLHEGQVGGNWRKLRLLSAAASNDFYPKANYVNEPKIFDNFLR